MRSKAFNSEVAKAYKVEEKTVVVYTRFLKAAKLLTSGARGINAPQMQPVDAARLTIALLATDKPARCVDMVKRFSGLKYNAKRSTGSHPIGLGVEDDITLEQVLRNVFSANWDEIDPFASAPYFEIQENARTATIEHKDGNVFFRDAIRTEVQEKLDRRELSGIRRARGVASVEMMNLCLPFYLERRDGISWEEMQKEHLTNVVKDDDKAIPESIRILLSPFIAKEGE